MRQAEAEFTVVKYCMGARGYLLHAVVESGYIAQAISDVINNDADTEDADQCSTLILETLPLKRIRISACRTLHSTVAFNLSGNI